MTPAPLPPLSLLPAFEAAGRLGSFKAAGRELGLTPSAISHQLKQLEDAVGTALFHRRARHVELTPAGRKYLPEVQACLVALAHATGGLRAPAPATTLRVSTFDLVTYEVLTPRLERYRQRFGRLELHVETSSTPADLGREDLDAAIRLDPVPTPGLACDPLLALTAAAVCAPDLATGIHTEADLWRHTLLEVRGQEHRGWHRYLGVPGIPLRREQILTVGSCYETCRAAEQGVGIGLGLFPLMTPWVLAGRLAVPLAARTPLPGLHYMRRSTAASGQHDEFRDWLIDELAELPALPEGRVVCGTQ